MPNDKHNQNNRLVRARFFENSIVRLILFKHIDNLSQGKGSEVNILWKQS